MLDITPLLGIARYLAKLTDLSEVVFSNLPPDSLKWTFFNNKKNIFLKKVKKRKERKYYGLKA